MLKGFIAVCILCAIVQGLLRHYFDEVFLYLGGFCAYFLPLFRNVEPPPQLDYSALSSWVSHPDIEDGADHVPPCDFSDIQDKQATAKADVFFVHPTGYLGLSWNAPAGNHWASDFLATIFAIVHGTAFNEVGRVFAPRYRQMSGLGFLVNESNVAVKADKERALALAYQDISAAFQVFLEKWNGDRPILLVGHSQGSKMLLMLLGEYFQKESVSVI